MKHDETDRHFKGWSPLEASMLAKDVEESPDFGAFLAITIEHDLMKFQDMREHDSPSPMPLKNWSSTVGYLIAFGKPAGHREVAPREFDVHSRWKPAREERKEGEEE